MLRQPEDTMNKSAMKPKAPTNAQSATRDLAAPDPAHATSSALRDNLILYLLNLSCPVEPATGVIDFGKPRSRTAMRG